ncbi:MAG TPA: hypothetical protein VHC69_32305 [Polyangiaceae bacterium]|nr:hypothetical protein [Polyangiaceae bacterium]
MAAITLVAAVSAEPPSRYVPYGVSLEDENGNTLRTFRGERTTFVLGYLGERYNVRLTNHGDRRVEAVLTVDGRDAVSGDPGDFVRQRGYIVPPHGSIVVNGFRQSLERAAAFRFSRPGASYSSRMGTPENVGVIGVAFFAERPTRRVATPTYIPRHFDEDASRPRASSASPAKRRASDSGDLEGGGSPSRLGTEYGESTYSPVSEVPFQRQNPVRPDALMSLRYDDADGLTARGFDVYPRESWSERAWDAPDAFPRSHFAPPPP